MKHLFGHTLKRAMRIALLSGSAVAATMLLTGPVKAQAKPVLSVSSITIVEGDTGNLPVNFTISLSEPSTTVITVSYNTKAQSATENIDYVGRSGKHTFKPGEVTAHIYTFVKGDTATEPSERFSLMITDVIGAEGRGKGGACTIIDNDSKSKPANALPELSVSSVEILEGDKGNRMAYFTIGLSKPSAVPVTVMVATKAGSATDGVDYLGGNEKITIRPRSNNYVLAFAIKADTVFEANEKFSLVASDVVGATVLRGTGVCTIMNDFDKK